MLFFLRSCFDKTCFRRVVSSVHCVALLPSISHCLAREGLSLYTEGGVSLYCLCLFLCLPSLASLKLWGKVHYTSPAGHLLRKPQHTRTLTLLLFTRHAKTQHHRKHKLAWGFSSDTAEGREQRHPLSLSLSPCLSLLLFTPDIHPSEFCLRLVCASLASGSLLLDSGFLHVICCAMSGSGRESRQLDGRKDGLDSSGAHVAQLRRLVWLLLVWASFLTMVLAASISLHFILPRPSNTTVWCGLVLLINRSCHLTITCELRSD